MDDEYAPEGAMGSLVSDAVSGAVASVREAVQAQVPRVEQVASNVAQTAARVATQAAARALPAPVEPRKVSWKRIAVGLAVVGGLGYLAWRMGWLGGKRKRRRRR